jgi:hypothetical protein
VFAERTPLSADVYKVIVNSMEGTGKIAFISDCIGDYEVWVMDEEARKQSRKVPSGCERVSAARARMHTRISSVQGVAPSWMNPLK